ncbi:kinesin-like protein KIN-10B isoform X2 [Miscanthus floridulus]|uniref:kinesin-like protein KIN-10B isoform X2 n=1 Tax=Miscanthus floridulus TaxID=154761 RepID=UPI0034591E33
MEAAAAAATAAPCLPSHSPRVRAAPVRVVARICPGVDPAGSFQVAARVPDPANSSSASVSFIPIIKEATPSGSTTPHKHREYKLDWCYLNDNSDTDIFQNEVKHLVDNIFCGDGRNHACVITCGSIAKTHLVMGSEDHPGLLTLAMERILDCAKPIRATVSVSSYQVLQDSHVFDILEPKDSEVLVREDADGRTHLKGLSKVGINSIQEFQNLCYGSDKLQNPTKASNQARGHRGFIIFISRIDQNGRECSVANMHFLELAGYINNKQNSHGGGFAQPNSKKSLYAVMDVVQSLNSHQSFIPYRKSKVTHILQDSLCKTSGALLIACLDEVSCQDAVSTLSLASRSSQVVNEQCYNLSLSTKGCSKSNVNLSVNAKNLSTSLLPSIQQRSSIVEKFDKTQFNNSAVKAARALNSNKRSETSTHSVKKAVNIVSASTNLKHSGAKSIMKGRNLFFRTTNSSKEVGTSICMEIQALPPIEEKRGDTKNSVISSEMQEVVPCSMKELVSSDVKEEDHSSSAENLYADLGMTCSSNAADKSTEKNLANVIQSSPKISDQLREISNSLKLLSTMPSSIVKQKADIVHAKPFDIVEVEPKTPEIHLKVGHVEDPQESLKARSTGFKKSLAKECLSFINSASKEQLKSLKGIGEKRANFILELREESPEPLKEIDDLRNIIGMSKTEINKMVSGMILDSEMD